MTARLSPEVERTALLDACTSVLQEVLDQCQVVYGEDIVLTTRPDISFDMQKRIRRLIEQRNRQRIYD